jgi:putative endonuclease
MTSDLPAASHASAATLVSSAESASPIAATDARQALGLLGERVAARWLIARGWTVVAHRFRSGHRDLDLVVRQGSLVAFVEVKARRAASYGGPLGALHWRKRRELVRSAQVWTARHGAPGETYRFDVVGVLLEPRSGRRHRGAEGHRNAPAAALEGQLRARVRHVADAFQLPPGS